MKTAVIILFLIVIAMVAYAVIDNRRDGKRHEEMRKKCAGKLIFGWME